MSCWSAFHLNGSRTSQPASSDKTVSHVHEYPANAITIGRLADRNLLDFERSFRPETKDELDQRVRKWLNYDEENKHIEFKRLKHRVLSGLYQLFRSRQEEHYSDPSALYLLQRCASLESGFSDFN